MMPGRPTENCAILNSFGILPQAILLYGFFAGSKCNCQGRSLSEKSEIEKPQFRCEIVSRLNWPRKKGWQVSSKGNRLRAGRSCKKCNVHSRRRRQA